jgi:superfamily II DNA or RNA helicase
MIEEIFGDAEPVAPTRLSLRGRQPEWIAKVEADVAAGKSRLLVCASGGAGKCLGRGTPVLMHDGIVKPVEEVSIGDLLMGPDSGPRVVVSLARGREMLYRITPIKGDPYVVNESHVLSLKVTCGRNKSFVWSGNRLGHGDTINIPVRQFVSEGEYFHRCTVGWRCGVEFSPKSLHENLPPYMLGLWLGDGTATNFSISKPDPEIRQAVFEYAQSIGMRVRESISTSKCPTYHVVSPEESIRGRGHRPNVATNALRDLGLLSNKHIPHAYLTSNRADRVQLLAGLMDSDGSLTNGGYDYICISKFLCLQVAYLARSLGLAAYVKQCEKGCQNGFVGTYYRLGISGDCSFIPCRIPRRKAAPRTQCKNVLVTGIRAEPIGEGDYFGFEINGADRLFLLGDFTVTHNTVVFGELAHRAWTQHKRRTLVTVCRESIVRQTARRMKEESGLDAEIEMGSESASPFAPVVVASTQSLQRLNRLTGFADDHFHYVFPDEAHFSVSPGSLRINNYFHYGAASLADDWQRPFDGQYQPKARVIGFTATPEDKLLDWYQDVSVRYPYIQAVLDGVLVPATMISIPVRIDLSRARVKRGTNGTDFDAHDLSDAIVPVIEKLADQIKEHASNRKTIAFLPSVETARLLSEALVRRGMDAVFVSGDCEDGDEKTEHFRKAEKGSVLCNAQIYNFGIDFVDCDCVAWFRPTLSRSFYLQGIFRASRVLRGVIDGIEDVRERRRAIAASAKPNFLILDPLFNHEKEGLDLCDPYDLFSEDKDQKKAIKKSGELSAEGAERAVRDYIKSLEKAAKAASRKKARIVNPLEWGVSLGDAALADYEPQTEAECRAPSDRQLDFLRRNHIDPKLITSAGLASRIIGTLIKRMKLGLAVPLQLDFLHKMGMSNEETALLSKEEAAAKIEELKRMR